MFISLIEDAHSDHIRRRAAIEKLPNTDSSSQRKMAFPLVCQSRVKVALTMTGIYKYMYNGTFGIDMGLGEIELWKQKSPVGKLCARSPYQILPHKTSREKSIHCKACTDN